MKTSLAAAALALATLSAPAYADHAGWFVIMGSFGNLAAANDREAEIADDCGMSAKVEDGANVGGFNPNVYFVYRGPYHSKARARAVLREARHCISDSYMKYSEGVD